MTQYLVSPKNPGLSALIAFALMDQPHGQIVVAKGEPSPPVIFIDEQSPYPPNKHALDSMEKARLKRERKNLKRLYDADVRLITTDR